MNTNAHEPYIYVIINKSLNMSPGKVASQAAHAAALTITNHETEDVELWANTFHKGIIVLEARDENHLRSIKDFLRQRNVNSDLVIDEGSSEVPSFSVTALATQMMTKDIGLSLFKGLSAYHVPTPEETMADLFIRHLLRG